MKHTIAVIITCALSCSAEPIPEPTVQQNAALYSCPHVHYNEVTGATESCTTCRIVTWGMAWLGDTVLNSHLRSGVSVTYRNATQLAWSFTTDSLGHWYPEVPKGLYTVTFSRPGVVKTIHDVEVTASGDCLGNVTF